MRYILYISIFLISCSFQQNTYQSLIKGKWAIVSLKNQKFEDQKARQPTEIKEGYFIFTDTLLNIQSGTSDGYVKYTIKDKLLTLNTYNKAHYQIKKLDSVNMILYAENIEQMKGWKLRSVQTVILKRIKDKQ